MGCHACDSELCEGSHNLPRMKRVFYLPRYPGIADTEGSQTSRGCHACDSELAKGTHNLPVNSRALCQLSYISKAAVAGLEPATS